MTHFLRILERFDLTDSTGIFIAINDLGGTGANKGLYIKKDGTLLKIFNSVLLL